MEPAEQKSNGALIGSIIIIVILVIGAIYFWQTSLRDKELREKQQQELQQQTQDSGIPSDTSDTPSSPSDDSVPQPE
ncbi:MAG TPA: hypothetical protein VG694_00665 [Candidatus Paceibacterota bacterium]|jgi:hypothetical protein|nr:hypothetical protein [Candidatus Paceibacterota bacterium]